MVAVPQNAISRQVGYEQKFKDSLKIAANLPQKITIFSPVADSKKSSANIVYNQRKSFETAQDVFDELGVCPAFYQMLILKPLSGGGVNGSVDIIPMHESFENPTEYYLYLDGSNKGNVYGNLIINGRQFIGGREISFNLSNSMTLDQKNEHIINAVNSNIFSPVYAEKAFSTATTKTYRTEVLTDKDKLFDVEDGGLTFQTNSGTYTLKLNTKGKSGVFSTKDLSTNLAGILGVASGSFKVKDGDLVEKEVIFKNAGADRTVVTQSLHKNYINFHDFSSSFTMSQGVYSFDFDINTKATNASQSTAVISSSKVASLANVKTGSIRIQTNEDASPIDLTGIDFTGVQTLYDVASVLNAKFRSQNVKCIVSKSSNSNRLIFLTFSSGASSTISVGSVSPLIGTDLTTYTYFDIANGGNVSGANSIEYATNENVVQGLVARFKDELSLDAFNLFSVEASDDNKEIVFFGVNNATDPIQFTHNSYNDLTSSNYFDFANAYFYTIDRSVDSGVKLAGYLDLQFKIAGLGGVAWDAGNSKLIFTSKSLKSGDVFSFSAGTTGTDLAGSSYLHFDSGSQVHGAYPKTTLSAVAQALNESANSLSANVEVLINNDDTFTFKNSTTTGSSTIFNILNSTGVVEDLSGADYFNKATMKVTNGLDGSSVVALRTKWDGTSSAGLKLEIKQSRPDPDLKFHFQEIFVGTGSVDFADAFQNFGDTWSTILLHPYGVDKLDVFEQFVGHADDKTGRYAYDNFKPCIAFTGTSEFEKVKFLSIAQGRSLDSANALCVAPKTKAWDFEISASYGLVTSLKYDDEPHLSTSGLYLADLPVPNDYNIGAMNTAGVREELLNAGVSTVTLDSNVGKYEIQDHVTFRHPPNQANTAVDYKYVRNIIAIDANVAYKTIDIMKRFLLGKAIVGEDVIVTVDDTIKIKDAKALFVNLFEDLSKIAIFYSSDKAVDSLSVEISKVNSNRLDVNFVYERSSTVKIVSTTASASFHFGGD